MKTEPEVGCSEVTRQKWSRLAALMDIHLRMVKGAIANPRDAVPAYFWIDLYAGPGLYEVRHDPALAGEIGSPLIGLRKIKDAGLLPAPYFGDASRETCDDLRISLQRDDHPEFVGKVFKGCCAESVDRLLCCHTNRRKFGLIFIDPNGYPDWDAVRLLAASPQWYCVDILINLNATIHKRCLKSSKNPETRRPTEHLRSLRKRYISLWNPASSDPHQFTLAYCTNQKVVEFKKLGFHGIDSEHGRAVAKLIDYPESERRALPPPPGVLPGVDWDSARINREPIKFPEPKGDDDSGANRESA